MRKQHLKTEHNTLKKELNTKTTKKSDSTPKNTKNFLQ